MAVRSCKDQPLCVHRRANGRLIISERVESAVLDARKNRRLELLSRTQMVYRRAQLDNRGVIYYIF